jgi:GntR family transcriptional regulator
VLPFVVQIVAGGPIAEQVIYAVKRAVVSGSLRSGDHFPSVRQLSRELRINPNTAHRVVAALVEQGVLITTPTVGTVVLGITPGSRLERSALLGSEMERLVVEAKRIGIPLDQMQQALAKHWHELEKK